MTTTKSLIRAVEDNDYAAVRRLAAQYHGGSHREITALSHGLEWRHVAIQNELEECLALPQGTPAEKRESDAAVTALLEFVKGSYPYVYWSHFGHTFQDQDDIGSCLTCGGEWEHVHTSKDDPRRGRYRASLGEDPTPCPGDSREHGDPRETGHSLECEGSCPRCDHTCNCLSCR